MAETTEKKQTYPKSRWNYATERWEKKTHKNDEWTQDSRKAKAKSVATQKFVEIWKGADSVAEIGRRLCWKRSKVKGTKTRINNQIKKSSWFSAFKDNKEKAKLYQLQDLPEFTPAQAATEAKQSSEGFATDMDQVMMAFMGKEALK
jgi:hypothetical protein